MKTNKKNNNSTGKGHQARLACEIKGSIKLPGQDLQEFEIKYDLSIVVEQIDYAVRLVAGKIAQVASQIASDETIIAQAAPDPTPAPAPSTEPATS